MTRMLSRTARLGIYSAAIAAIVTSGSGCASVAGWFSGATNAVATKAKERQDLAEIRRDTRDELADQREETRKQAAEQEIQLAKLAAERARLEQAICQSRQEEAQQRVKSQLRDTLESKVAFNVQQGLEVGELEVDLDELKAIIEAREKQPPTTSPPQQEGKEKPPCSCCDQPCGCEPGLLRRLCPKCRTKPCEEKCGGPATYEQLAQQNARQPLRPTEIPLKLPVRLTFGMQNPSIEDARVRTQPPTSPGTQEGKQPCDGACPTGEPCTDKAPRTSSQPSGPASSRRSLSFDALEIPQPTWDESARIAPQDTIYSARLPDNLLESGIDLNLPMPAEPLHAQPRTRR